MLWSFSCQHLLRHKTLIYPVSSIGSVSTHHFTSLQISNKTFSLKLWCFHMKMTGHILFVMYVFHFPSVPLPRFAFTSVQSSISKKLFNFFYIKRPMLINIDESYFPASTYFNFDLSFELNLTFYEFCLKKPFKIVSSNSMCRYVLICADTYYRLATRL